METGLRTLADLFVEGTEAYLGQTDDGKPVVIWMNKLNAFQVEEAIRDASVRRAERMSELGPDSPETRGAKVEVDLWTDEQLRQAIVNDEGESLTLEAMQNLQTQEDWLELEDYIGRAPKLLRDESVKPGDPRFEALDKKLGEYNSRMQAEVTKVIDEHIKDLAGISREKLEAKFMEGWRQRRTTEEWLGAKRTTELYLAARECKAVMKEPEETLAGEMIGETAWDHSACDHSVLFFSERASLLRVPDGAMKIMVRVFEEQRTNPRDAGNSDAPASSSASSEPSSAPEEASSPSSPIETPDAVPTS